jgi:lipoic acid synthetase
VLEARPDLFNHNLETIRRLHPVVRPQAKYDRSLDVIRRIRQLDSQRTTKSGLMVGMGETQEEMREALRDLRAAGCEILTVGQYLSPSKEHYPVAEYVAPDVFTAYREYAMELGFRAAFCGPFVRSSYQAEQVLEHSRWKRC